MHQESIMLPKNEVRCPDCDGQSLDRRAFLGAAAAALGVLGTQSAIAAPSKTGKAETLVKTLYETLKEKQREKICFGWDHVHKDRGLLRTHVSNNWHITQPSIKSDFYTKEQQALVL